MAGGETMEPPSFHTTLKALADAEAENDKIKNLKDYLGKT
jgi:hypothetical protein